jgi:hypothetical protein
LVFDVRFTAMIFKIILGCFEKYNEIIY